MPSHALSRLVMSALTGALRVIIAVMNLMIAVTGIMARPLTPVIARTFVLAVTLRTSVQALASLVYLHLSSVLTSVTRGFFSGALNPTRSAKKYATSGVIVIVV